MKYLMNYLTAALFLALTVLSSCGSDDGGGDEDSVDFTAMNGTYTAVNISEPTGASDGDWSAFSLTISGASSAGGNYTTSGVPEGFESVWPASGSFTIDAAQLPSVVFIRDGSTSIDVELDVDDKLAELTFDVATTSARTSVVDGEWSFTVEIAE